MLKHLVAVGCLLASTFVSNVGQAGQDEAKISIATIAEPPVEAGIDRLALRAAAEEAMKDLDLTDVRRPVSVAVAIVSAGSAPTANCVISIAVQDKKKGTILGSVAGTASGNPSSRGDQRASVARTAVANAMSRVPDVVIASN